MLFDIFRKRPPSARQRRVEPKLGKQGTAPRTGATVSGAAKTRAAPALPAPPVVEDARLMSPRDMAGWVHELYVAGVISWEEYGYAIPPQLHPDYDRTVGALTGERAEPDRPRDMLKEWEDKISFLRRHRAWDDSELRQSERILGLMRRRLLPAG